MISPGYLIFLFEVVGVIIISFEGKGEGKGEDEGEGKGEDAGEGKGKDKDEDAGEGNGKDEDEGKGVITVSFKNCTDTRLQKKQIQYVKP